MLHLMVPMLLFCATQDTIPSNIEYLNLWIKHSDLVVVAKYARYGGAYDTVCGDRPDNLDEERIVETFGFDVRLKAYGAHEGDDMTVLLPTADRPGDRFAPSVNMFRDDVSYLMFLHKPRGGLVFQAYEESRWYRAASPDHFYLPLRGYEANAIVVPDTTYRAEGATPVEAFVGILSQAFAADRDVRFLRKIQAVRPRWRRQEGVPVPQEYASADYRGSYDGPTFFAFVRNTVKPRLLRAAGSDPLLKLHVYDVLMGCADASVKDEQRALLLNFDRTWRDTAVYAPIGATDADWCLRLLNARLYTFRQQALMGLPKDREHTRAVRRMLDDPEIPVRSAAVRWFESAYRRDMEADPDAPKLPTIYDGRRNFEDDLRRCVEYWKRKIL